MLSVKKKIFFKFQALACQAIEYTHHIVPNIVFNQILQYIPRNMHTVFALLCFVVVIHWLISPYPSGLLHWHCGNLTIAPVPAKQPWWIRINTSCEFIMNDCITTTKQSTTKPCAYFLGYTVWRHTTLDIALPIMIGSYVRMASDCRISAKKHVSVKKAPSSAQPR